MKHKVQMRILATVGIMALSSWTGATVYADYDPATHTDTLTNQMVSPSRGNTAVGDFSTYDHADRNLVIQWNNNSRGDGAPIRDARVNAKNITINADFSGNQWTDKGIISDGTTHVTAGGDINITTNNDAVYTQENGSTTIDGFKNLTIKATGHEESYRSIFGFKIFLGYTGGYGLVDNGNGITVQGGEDSTVHISNAASIQAAVGNSVKNVRTGTGITISAGQIAIDSPYMAVFAGLGKKGDFAVNLNASTVDIRGLVKASQGGTVSINPDTEGTVSLAAGQGGYEKIEPSSNSIESSGKGSRVSINENRGGKVQIAGNIAAASGGTVSIQGTTAESLIRGDLQASGGGTLDLKLTGSQSTLQGNLTNTDSTSSVTLGNASTWIGDLTSTSGTASVNLDGSHWEGSSTGNGDITLTNGSLWTLGADSTANSVNPDAGSLISLAGTARKLETQSLGGSGGTFLMDLNYQGDDVATYREGDSSDFLVAHGGNGSTYGVALSGDSSVNGMTEGSKLYFASTAADSSAFRLNQDVEVQNYNKIYNKNLSVLKDTGKLSVKKETDATGSDFDGYDNWYLTPDSSKGHDGDTINPNGMVPGSAANTAFALWRDDDTLLRRLGELRYNESTDGVWALFVNKQLSRDGAHGFKGNYKTLQVGYDWKRSTEKNGDWYYGAAVSHLWGDTDYNEGHGSQKSTDLSLYGTNVRSHGHYLDLIARVGRIDSDYTSSYSDQGKFENWGTSLGAEYGRKKDFGHGWTLEPQAQLTYHYLWGDDYTTRNGARVSQDNADSLVGRLGFVVAKEFNQGTAKAGRVYLKASVLHDFLGGTGSTLVDDIRYRDDDDLGDTWYVAGIGTNIHFGKDTQFYFDAERNFNADVRMKYRFNAGFRFGF